jgi:hypothetical protein
LKGASARKRCALFFLDSSLLHLDTSLASQKHLVEGFSAIMLSRNQMSDMFTRDRGSLFPVISLGHAEDVGSGSLLPAISVDQNGGTLARWFGLSDTQIAEVFPNIANFMNRNLGFMT